jgi:uridylate kinase
MKKRYNRILLKLSGEGLMGNQLYGIDNDVLDKITEGIKKAYDKKIELCIVIGGGNFYRGVNNTNKYVNRSVADQAGMIATIINALFLKSALQAKGMPVEILSGLNAPQVVEAYSYRKAQELLGKGYILIFAGGTGNPYFTTDTGATLRALETGCDALFKATQVDGVYDSDPKKNPKAKRFKEVSYEEVITKELRVMDMTAISMARENKLPVVVFKQEGINSLIDALNGKGNYTTIK